MPSDVLTHDLSSAELGDEIRNLAAHIAAATYRWLRLLAEFDRRTGWGGAGLKSPAHWLSWKCGVSLHRGSPPTASR